MPRTKPTTTYTPRVQPTTTYSNPRFGERLTCDTNDFTCDSTLVTCDATKVPGTFIQSSYSRPRFGKYVQDLMGANVFDLSGNQVEGISGEITNKVNTIYT